MIIIWLVVWLIQGTPHVGDGNSWAVSLLVCTIAGTLTALSGLRRRL